MAKSFPSHVRFVVPNELLPIMKITMNRLRSYGYASPIISSGTANWIRFLESDEEDERLRPKIQTL